jgi:superoxide dismutase, Fe-Mn family
MISYHQEAEGDRVPNMVRRRLLGSIAVATSAFVLGITKRGLAAAPKEAGLSFEGLLKNQPGFQPRRIAPVSYAEIPGFLSNRQLERNYDVYRNAFATLVAAESRLAVTSRDAGQSHVYAALRNQQIVAANSVLLHEFYFSNLTAAPATPSRYVTANMNEHMGSIADWREDFIACVRVAEEWAVLMYDPYDDRWHGTALGANNAAGWAGGNPLIVCDVADHAWSTDYTSREDYARRFLQHLDWRVVETRYRAVDRQ